MTSTSGLVPGFRLHRFPVDLDDQLARDVRAGLGATPKTIPPTHFYDDVGCRLFEEITRLPEYYQTRTELQILAANAADVVDTYAPTELVELGSGSSRKTATLLQAMHDDGKLHRFVPFDVAESAIVSAAERLRRQFPEVEIEGVVGDFATHLDAIPARSPADRRMVIFLGGTIGNFLPDHRRRFLRDLRGLLQPGDSALIGIDLVKDTAQLEAAYNDTAGVTAAFNRNVLHVINRDLGADFEPNHFEHVAFYDPDRRWIEMRLRADRAMAVQIGALDMTVRFAEGEEVRTEISAKFSPDHFAAELTAVGLRAAEVLTDEQDRFALVVALPEAEGL